MNCDACENGVKVPGSMHGLDCPKRVRAKRAPRMSVAPSEVVTLYVVDIAPFKEADVRVRTFQYSRSKTTLTAIEENDGPSAPHGLRRISVQKLPAVGGLFGLSVAAETKAAAIEKLLKVAEKERAVAAERAFVLAAGIEKLKKLG